MTIRDDICADKLWDWLLHEDELFHKRVPIFIGLQTLLFAGAGSNIFEKMQPVRIILGSAGLLVALLWGLAMSRQRIDTTDKLKRAIRNYGKAQPSGSFYFTYEEIASGRRAIGLNMIIGELLPFIFVVSWLYIIFRLACATT